MSNDQKNQSQQSQKMTGDEANAKIKTISKILSSWIRLFYRGNNESGAALGEEATLWDLRTAPRGLTAYFVARSGAPITPFVILVSKHEMHIKPPEADEMVRTWRQISESGVLRS